MAGRSHQRVCAKTRGTVLSIKQGPNSWPIVIAFVVKTNLEQALPDAQRGWKLQITGMAAENSWRGIIELSVVAENSWEGD